MIPFQASSPTPSPVPTNATEWSVSDLAGALKRTLEDAFGNVRLRGEITGYRGQHGSGHAYFCLKDRDARIDAVIWKGTFARLRFKPQEGLEVVASGRITTFPGKSTYQIVVDQLEPAGIGALMALLEARRHQLTAEGLFAAERKRRLPYLPRVVGIVTSPTGAVIRDILHRLADRFPRHVLVWPVRVQGETCAAEVAAAIRGFNALAPGGPIPRPDVLIVARGGGSLEDLWGFNEEAVVRAAAASAIPLIAAIGHETDWTLIDHAADLRAPTPTGAAEMAVPVRADLVGQVGTLALRHADAARRILDGRRTELRSAARALPGPEALLAPPRQRLDLSGARLAPGLLANLRVNERALADVSRKLGRHSPNVELGKARTRLDHVGGRPREALRRAMAARSDRIGDLAQRLAAGRARLVTTERGRIAGCHERVAGLWARAGRAIGADLARRTTRTEALAGLLGSLGYRAVLSRGFALVRMADGRPVARAAQLGVGESVRIEFADAGRGAIIVGEASARRRAGARHAALGDGATPEAGAGPLAQPSLFDT